MNNIEASIIIQKELDICNEKIKFYDIKYNTHNNKTIKILYDYLINKINDCEEEEKNKINDDIQLLLKYL